MARRPKVVLSVRVSAELKASLEGEAERLDMPLVWLVDRYLRMGLEGGAPGVRYERVRPHGCICPPGAEKGCRSVSCPRGWLGSPVELRVGGVGG